MPVYVENRTVLHWKGKEWREVGTGCGSRANHERIFVVRPARRESAMYCRNLFLDQRRRICVFVIYF